MFSICYIRQELSVKLSPEFELEFLFVMRRLWSLGLTNTIPLKSPSDFPAYRQVPGSALKVSHPSLRVRNRPGSAAWKMTLPFLFYVFNLLYSTGVVCLGSIKDSRTHYTVVQILHVESA